MKQIAYLKYKFSVQSSNFYNCKYSGGVVANNMKTCLYIYIYIYIYIERERERERESIQVEMILQIQLW